MSQSIDIDGFCLVSGGVLVFWQWEWMNDVDIQSDEHDGDDASHTSIYCNTRNKRRKTKMSKKRVKKVI